MFWPSNLAVFYPFKGLQVPWQVLGSIFLFIVITLVVIWRAKEIALFGNGLVVVCRHACSCYRDSAGARRHGGPIDLYSSDRVIHHGYGRRHDDE